MYILYIHTHCFLDRFPEDRLQFYKTLKDKHIPNQYGETEAVKLRRLGTKSPAGYRSREPSHRGVTGQTVLLLLQKRAIEPKDLYVLGNCNLETVESSLCQ